MTWAEQELGGAPLGDARLSRRLVKLATRLAENPSASIPQACRGWAEMRAAYRFLGRDKLDWQDILQPHWEASAQRMREHPVVLCLQDTTELDVRAGFENLLCHRLRAGSARMRILRTVSALSRACWRNLIATPWQEKGSHEKSTQAVRAECFDLVGDTWIEHVTPAV